MTPVLMKRLKMGSRKLSFKSEKAKIVKEALERFLLLDGMTHYCPVTIQPLDTRARDLMVNKWRLVSKIIHDIF